jgi:polysaccharide export outer membrane protein
MAPPVENVQTLDLTRLTGFAVSNELIEPGDVLEVTIASGYSERGPMIIPVRVGEDGTANIPLIGQIALAGFELNGAENAIRTAAIARSIFRNPHVTVVMEKKRVNKVTVIGAVNEPGIYDVPRGSSDLLAALVAAGGLAEDAGTEVEIRSPAHRTAGPAPGDRLAGTPEARQAQFQTPQYQAARSTRIDLIEATRSGQGGISLGDGDVVMVMKRDPKPVHVIGLVNKPGQYEMPSNQDLRVLDALAMAGGTSSTVAERIYVIRRVPGKAEASVIKVRISKAKHDGTENLRLAAGDVVSIEQSPATFALDAAKSFVRIGLSSTVPMF